MTAPTERSTMTRDKRPPARTPRARDATGKVATAMTAANKASPRHKQENAERMFWSAINGKRFHGFKFFRNFAIGPHSAGFVCLKSKLVVDIDSTQHVKGKVNERAEDLKKLGYGVMHFWNSDVVDNIEGVLHKVLQQLRKAGDHGPQ